MTTSSAVPSSGATSSDAPPRPDPENRDSSANTEFHQAAALEIERLAGSNVPENQFFERFLQRTAECASAVAGAVWMLDPQGRIGAMSDLALDVLGWDGDADKQRQNMALLVEVLQAGQAAIHVPGESGQDATSQPARGAVGADSVSRTDRGRGAIIFARRFSARISFGAFAIHRGNGRLRHAVSQLAR